MTGDPTDDIDDHLTKTGVVACHERDGETFRMWVSADGVNLANLHDMADIEVWEVGPAYLYDPPAGEAETAGGHVGTTHISFRVNSEAAE